MFNGFPLESLWLDVEEGGLKQSDVDRDLALCDKHQGSLTGIYSAKWVFSMMGWLGVTKWARRALWTANYDDIPDPDVGFVPFSGWASCAAKQYRGTTTVGVVSEIDLSVFR